MYTLLTGATGLVGRYLVRDFLLNEHRVAVVVRPSRRQGAADRIEEILQHWERELGRLLPRPVVLAGDICEPGFGLSEDDREWTRTHCTSIIHNAAILEFYGSDRAGEPWRTNLRGTENMIALCRELGIRDIHHVSTAYVAGYCDDVVMEDRLDVGQSFRNDYEESKFLAEKLVRNIDFADHITVYRPAVIAGDSVTGYTNTYHGIYLYLRLMALMIPAIPVGDDGKRWTPIRLQMTGNERRNIIPVDWVSAVITRLFETPAARGLTFHLAPDKPISSGKIVQYCGEYFNSTGATFSMLDDAGDAGPQISPTREENEDQWMFERLYTENMGTYAPYERTDNIFDTTNTKRFAADIPCPEIDRTVIHRYITFGEQDRWGKRRPETVPPAFVIEEFFSDLPDTAAATASDMACGLDLTGPGGGQLTLELSPSGLRSVTRGLVSGKIPVLTLSAEEFVAILTSDDSHDHSLMVNAWDVPNVAAARELTDRLLSCLQRGRVSGSVQTIS